MENGTKEGREKSAKGAIMSIAELKREDLLTLEGVAAMVGVSVGTVRRKVGLGEMPQPLAAMAPAKRWLREDIQRWMTDRDKK